MQLIRWIDRWHWVFLLAVAPLLLFPSPSRSFAMLVVPGLWLIGLLARRDPLRRTPLNLALLILAVMTLVSLYATYDIAQSFPRLATFVFEFGVFFALVRKGRRARGWWIGLALWLAIGLGVAGLGLVSAQSAKFGIFAALTARLPILRAGFLGADQSMNPNLVAGTLLWIMPMLFALAAHAWRNRRDVRDEIGPAKTFLLTLALGGAGLFAFGAFVLMQSRTSYLGFAVMLVAGLLAWMIARRKYLIGIALIVVLLAGGIGASIFMFRESDLSNIVMPDPGSSIETVEGRLEVWSRALYGIQDFPFTGMGLDTFRRIVHVLYPLFSIGPDVETIHAHNEYLVSALDLGIPGLIAFLALYLGAYRMLWFCWRATRMQVGMLDEWTPAVILGLAGGLGAHMVFGLSDAIIFVARYDLLFWMLLGLIAALYRRTTRLMQRVPRDTRSVAPASAPEAL